jgi:hypothetical protein
LERRAPSRLEGDFQFKLAEAVPGAPFRQNHRLAANDRTVICRSAGVHLGFVQWAWLQFQNNQQTLKPNYEN